MFITVAENAADLYRMPAMFFFPSTSGTNPEEKRIKSKEYYLLDGLCALQTSLWFMWLLVGELTAEP